jgi:hypothetical protein
MDSIFRKAQMQSAWCAPLQDIELMPQYQDFGFQPPRDLKQSHSAQTKRKAIAIMRRSCSDSLLTASQMDGVFGSDKCNATWQSGSWLGSK